jgi:AcrR family transcriptional regulator
MGRKGPRPGLDEAAVLRAAAALVDAEGLDALHLGRLADALDVRAPSLYNHVAGLEGIRRGLALMGICELRDRLARAAIGKSGEQALYAIADAYRQLAKEHPGLYAASLRAPDPDDIALTAAAADVLSIIHAVLAPYGLQHEAEVHAIRAFRSLAHGFVSLEVAGAFGMPVAIDESYRVLVRLLLLGLRRQSTGDASALA